MTHFGVFNQCHFNALATSLGPWASAVSGTPFSSSGLEDAV